MIQRKLTKTVPLGSLIIGDNQPIRIQSMTNTRTEDIKATVEQIQRLDKAGCEIIRVAVPTEKAAEAVKEIKKEISIPLVGDIHFDYQLAIKVLKNGADKIRINPGNIGSFDRVERIIDEAGKLGKTIRIGVNSGSLEKEILEKFNHPTADALAESALNWTEFFLKKNFFQLIVSIKSSDVLENYFANVLYSEKSDYPLHIGITEAGFLEDGLIKSSAGIGALLMKGIGDTIRVSLTGDPEQEIEAGRKLLQYLNIRKFSPEIISCPTCGRCQIQLEELVKKVKEDLKEIQKPYKIAIMGCVVNGPGEAKEADYGIAGGIDEGILFRRGKIIQRLPFLELPGALLELIKKED